MAPVVDAASPAIATNTTSANLTTGSFNPPACLLVVELGGDGAGNMTPTISNNGTALTWSNRSERDLGDAGAQSGHSSIHTAELTSGRTGMTVTAALSGTGAGAKALKVYCVTGYDSADPVGNAPGEGSSTTNSITPTIISAVESANSLLFVVANDWNQLGTPASSDLTIDTYNISGSISGLMGRKAGPGSAGSSATANLDAAGSSAPAWNWASVEIEPAGGTTFNQSVAGTVTPAGAVVRQPGKALAGSTTPAGALLRTAGKALAGAVTPAGALTRQVAKVLAGTVTPAGVLAVVKAVLRSFTGSLTPAGVLARRPGKALGGAVAPSGAAARSTAKTFAGAVSPAGALATIKAVLRSFAGTVTPSGALVRQAGKQLASSTTPAGTLVRRAAKTLSGALTPAGALGTVKAVLRSFAGSVAPAGVLGRRVGKALTGAVAPTAVVVKLLARTLAGTVAAAGALAKQQTKTFTGAVGPAGGVAAAVVATPPPSVVPRPNTGTVTRPDSGVVHRPFTGTVTRP